MRHLIYHLLFWAFSFGIFHSSIAQKQAADKRPNILIIHSDDHDQSAISAYGGNLIKTPNIDRIAQNGIVCRNSFVSNSICAPSRAVLLTGKHSHLNGQKDNRTVFNGNQGTLPRYLKASGYSTALIGKWHLKSDPIGFDYWEVLEDQGHYYNPIFVSEKGRNRNEGYATELIAQKTIDYLKQAPKNKPFLMMMQHKAPHRGWLPPLDLMHSLDTVNFKMPSTFYKKGNTKAAQIQAMEIARDMYPTGDLKLHPNVAEKWNVSGWDKPNNLTYWKKEYNRMNPTQKAAWDKLMDKRTADFIKANPAGEEIDQWKHQQYMRDYLGCILSLDREIGKVLDYLEQSGLAENTIIIYTSDQGFWLGQRGWFDKRFMYDQSMRTPLIISYKGKVAKGKDYFGMVQNLDLAPTLLAAAGFPIPKDMQGKNILPEITNPKVDKVVSTRALYYRYYEHPSEHNVLPHYGIRTNTHKLIYFPSEDIYELYNLVSDPEEMENLAENPAHKSLLTQLKTQLAKEKSRLKDFE